MTDSPAALRWSLISCSVVPLSFASLGKTPFSFSSRWMTSNRYVLDWTASLLSLAVVERKGLCGKLSGAAMVLELVVVR
jgi:hypothetical protein